MDRQPVSGLPGMRDVTGREYARLKGVADAIATGLGAHGYEPIDTPLLEETEFLVRKSGGELTSKLYSFTDPGGRRVSLRPEFTTSVIRYFVQAGSDLDLPVRWRYTGPVFRYEEGPEAEYRQFTQVGAELIGAGGVEADAEVLSLAWHAIPDAVREGYRIRVGHLGVLNKLLEGFGLSDRARLFVASCIGALRDGSVAAPDLVEQARNVGLLAAEDDPRGLRATRLGNGEQPTREMIEGVLAGAVTGAVGRRSPREILERLLRKMDEADSAKDLRAALTLVHDLARADGPPMAVLEQGVRIVGGRGLDASSLDAVGELLSRLADGGVPESGTVLDFGLARGIAYYTGVTFDILDGSSSVVGGGGRYDGLVKSLGGDDVAALGFAFNLERLVALGSTPIAEGKVASTGNP